MDSFSNGITIKTRKALKTLQSPWCESPFHLCADKSELSEGETAAPRGIPTSVISAAWSHPLWPSEGLKHLRKTNLRASLWIILTESSFKYLVPISTFHQLSWKALMRLWPLVPRGHERLSHSPWVLLLPLLNWLLLARSRNNYCWRTGKWEKPSQNQDLFCDELLSIKN